MTTHLSALVEARVAAAANANAASVATRDLVVAIAALRTGRPAHAEAAAAVAGFRALSWPLFERLARSLGPSADPVPLAPERLLSAREMEIAQLIAAGATNAGIAGRLHIGVKTVEKHVSRILFKLGARSRAQIAAFVTLAGK